MVAPVTPDALPESARERIDAALTPAAVFMFGSRVTGRATATSDYDIAVLESTSSPDWMETRRLVTDLEDKLRAPVDLVLLKDASPILAMQVLREGVLVACRDADAVERFAVRTWTDYADLKHTRKPIEDRLMEASTT